MYNMLDQDEGQRTGGLSTPQMFTNPAAYQVQTTTTPDQAQVFLAHNGSQKPKCSHCHKIGHTADKCYKLHGYPPGFTSKWKKPQTIGTTNLAATQCQSSLDQKENMEYSCDEMSTDQIQTVISYLSSKLHTTTASPHTSTNPSASTSSSVPNLDP
ncbi:hypothetical protein CARUB_v10022035mg [Capsella rubella]|uniref:Uncharacterized protein n=1 Tax=Capsella rubella TaxID=81985 RepID=R0HXH5_9BRAS|nr:hypothetical protein CARUB_v10022035mg [Capsella rubella]